MNKKYLILLCSSILLSACHNQSISGTYVSHNSTTASLLQITETADQHIIGTLNLVSLDKDGKSITENHNISGVVDNDNLTVIVQNSSSPILGSQNLSGTIHDNEIDLNIQHNDLSEVWSLKKGNASEFNQYTEQLEIEGAKIISKHAQEMENEREQERIQTIDKNALVLSNQINEFINNIKHNESIIIPSLNTYYNKALIIEGNHLKQIKILVNSHNDIQISQAKLIQSQMDLDLNDIINVEKKIQAIQKNTNEQIVQFDNKIIQFKDSCLDNNEQIAHCAILSNTVSNYNNMKIIIENSHNEVNSIIKNNNDKINNIYKEAKILTQ